MTEPEPGRHTLRPLGVGREYVRSEAEFGVVPRRDHLLLATEHRHRHQRPEGFLAVAVHRPVHPQDHGWREEQALPQVLGPGTGNQAGALGQGILQVAPDLVEAGTVDQRPDVHTGLQAVADGQSGHPVGQFSGEGIGHLLVHEDAVGADTGLTTAPEFVRHQVVRGGVQVGVVKDNERRVATQLQGQFLDLGRGVQDQLPAHFGGAGEAQHGHIRMLAQHLADHAGLTHHQVDHAIGQPQAVQQAEEGNHGQRCFTGRFDHRRAAGRQCRREFLGDHADGKVPGHDQAGHAHRPVVHRPAAALGFLRQGVGVQRLDVLGTVVEKAGGVVHLALGFQPGFAVFHAQDATNFLPVRQQAVPDAFQPLAPGVQRVGLGQPQCRLAGFNGRFDVLGGHGRHPGDHLAGGRVVDIEGPASGAVPPASANVAREVFQQR